MTDGEEAIDELTAKIERLERLAILDHMHEHVLPYTRQQLSNERTHILAELAAEYSAKVSNRQRGISDQ